MKKYWLTRLTVGLVIVALIALFIHYQRSSARSHPPSQVFVLTGYANYEGSKAYIFEGVVPGDQTALGPAVYKTVCDGHIDVVDNASCDTIDPYLGKIIPPAYVRSLDYPYDDGLLEIQIPSLNLQFLVEEVE